ncbi:hypothetical protein F7G05_29095, partial [Escherichia coli]
METGKDAKALQIIKLAELYDIPVIEDIPLARTLYKNFTGLNAYQALVVVAFFVFLLWKGVLFGYLLFSVFDFWFQKH